MKISRRVLDNGLSVLLVEDDSAPTVSLWTWYRVGSRFERPGQTGISHWVEHMLFKGARRPGEASLTSKFSRLGAHFDAHTGYDYTAYFETLPASAWEVAPEVEADRMTSIVFTAEDTELERTVILAELGMYENNPAAVLAEEVTSVAFKVHPYRQPVIGWRQDLQRITREDLVAFYNAYYCPTNAVVVLVGPVREGNALDVLNHHFGRLQPRSVPPSPSFCEPPQEGERRIVLQRPGGTVPIVHIAYHRPQASHRDTAALMMLDAVLSGGKPIRRFQQTTMGRSSRFYRSLVRAKLATSAQSGMFPTAEPGLFEVSATVQAGVSPEAVEATITAEIARLQREPISGPELQSAAKQIRAQVAYGLDNAADRAWWSGLLELTNIGDWTETFANQIEGVTAEDIRRVARAYLQPRNRTVGWYLPEISTGNIQSHAIAQSLGGSERA